MPKSPDEAENQTVVNNFNDDLTRLSQDLFCNRADILMRFYGDVFDSNRKCVELIAMPTANGKLTPTLYMLHREAKFVLDADPDESIELDRLWLMLHMLVRDRINESALANMATLNTDARRQVLQCKDYMMDSIPALFSMLETHHKRAKRYAKDVVKEISQTFDGIVASYPSTLQSYRPV